MLSLAYQKKSFSTMVGGGDHGMDIGIDLSIMIQVGGAMEEFHFGMAGYLMIGGRITETISGEVIHGTIIIYLILIFKETGGPGIIPTIGISQNIENLRIIMMEGRMVLDKETFTKILRVLKLTVQVEPPWVNMLQDRLAKVNIPQVKLLQANILRGTLLQINIL